MGLLPLTLRGPPGPWLCVLHASVSHSSGMDGAQGVPSTELDCMGFREGKSPREQVTETNEDHQGQLTKKKIKGGAFWRKS